MMQERPRYVEVLFTEGESTSWYQKAVHAAIRFFSCSQIVHCAIASDEIVLNASFAGVTAYDAIDYRRKVKGLVWSIRVPVLRNPDLISWHQNRPRKLSLIYPILRWATFGLTPSRDCVAIVAAALRSAGVEVPRRATTPARIFDWLRKQGHDLKDIGRRTDLAGAGDRVRECSTDSMARPARAARRNSICQRHCRSGRARI